MTYVDPLKIDAAGGAVTDEQTVAIERTVIGAMIADRSVMRWIGDEVVGADFADSRLGRIFDGFWEMVGDKVPISAITVAEQLEKWRVNGITVADLGSWASDVLPHETGWFAAKVHELGRLRALRAEGVRLVQMSNSTSTPSGELLASAISSLRDLQTRGFRETVSAVPLTKVLDLVDDSYDFVVEDLLERGDRLILTGAEGGGKTTLLRQIAIMAAAGLNPFSHFKTKPARVLYVDVENSEKQWAREARRMVETAQMNGIDGFEDRFFLHAAKRMDLTHDRDLGALHQLVDEHRPDILFIGPLYRLTPRAINSDDEATPLLTALDTIHDRGVTLAIEAHAGHGPNGAGERDLRPRGSSALMGWPEFGLGIRPDKNTRHEAQLVRWRGHRDASRKWPSRLARGVSAWPWTPTIAGMR